MKKYRTFPTILFLYTVLALIMTFPLIFNLYTHVPGWVDVWQSMWFLWHAKVAFTDPEEFLFFTHFLFYPTGTPLIPQSLFNQLLSIPLQFVFTLSITYNILFLSSFVFSGITTFYLIKYLTKNSYAAFIGGLVYAFAPNTLAHALGHLSLITTGWIPLYVLLLFKIAEKKYSFREEAKSAFLAAIGLIMVAASDLQYMIFLIIFTGMFVVYRMVIVDRTIAFLISRKFIIFCGIFLIGTLPFTYSLIQYTFSNQNFLELPFSESIKHSADLVGFFIPSKLHSLFGIYTAPIYSKFTGGYSENVTFIGYTVLILIAYVFFKCKGQKVTFWKISFLFTFVLSLGPILHIMGKTLFNEKTIPLPYLVFYYFMPFIQNARTPGRMDVLVMLSAAVLTGYGVSQLFKPLNAFRKTIVAIILSLVILFEFVVIPFPLSRVDEPYFYKNLSYDENKNITLIELPMSYSNGVKSMYYQTIHGKRITGGSIQREPSYVYQFITNTPVLNELVHNEFELIDDIIPQNKSEKKQAGLAILNYYNIKYVVLTVEDLTAQQLINVTNILNEIGAQKIIQTERQVVYEIPAYQPTNFMIIGKGWHYVENGNNIPARWMENDATLKVSLQENRTVIFGFQATSFYRPRTLQMYANDKLLLQTNISSKNVSSETIELNLQSGENTLGFYTPDGCQIPREIPNLKNGDSRCLSLVFQNITIT